jgi:endonuclease/exonuclease/phosphatase family metal-dependent hydrolase
MLMGDFNTKSTTGEYSHLVNLFSMRDLYKEHINKTGELERATFDCGSNSLICEPKGHERRIDYIFALDSYKYSDNSSQV